MLKYITLAALLPLAAACTPAPQAPILDYTPPPAQKMLGYCSMPKPAPGKTAVWYERDAAG